MPFKSLIRRKHRPLYVQITDNTEGQPVAGPQQQSTSLPVTDNSVHPIGFETLFEGVDPIAADIVFIHGLCGHRRDSWTRDNVYWPKDLLSEEEGLSHVRILAFGYDASIVNAKGRGSLNSLFEHSINLLPALTRERKGELRDRPIVFVAHSLGGLILKDALDRSERMGDVQPELATIIAATRGIIFLGTPHRGTSQASLAKFAATIAQAVMKTTNNGLIRDLEADSQTLDRIRDSFSRILYKQSLTIWSFIEELPMSSVAGIGRLVERDSATIGDARENRETIHADHVGMAKFADRKDPGYKAILNAIETVLGSIEQNPPGTSDPTRVSADADPVSDAVTYYHIPRIAVLHLVPREILLAKLREQLEQPSLNSSTSVAVVLGMGGVGKTQLVLEYCRRAKSSRKYRGMFWVDASSQAALQGSMKSIALKLFPERVPGGPGDTANLVMNALSSWDADWLMVFDSLDNPSDLNAARELFPDSSCGSIIVTTRHAGSRELGHCIELGQMDKGECVQLLLRSATPATEELSTANQILLLLGYLPLAIDQARAYIQRRNLALRDFMEEYERKKEEILKETPMLWQYRRKLPDSEREAVLSIFTTWELSLSQLGRGSEQAEKLQDVLTLFSFFRHARISEQLFQHFDDWTKSPIPRRTVRSFTKILPSNIPRCRRLKAALTNLTVISPMEMFHHNGCWNHDSYVNAVVQMRELSLLQFLWRDGSEIVVTLHSMVSEWLRMRLESRSTLPYLQSAVHHLKKYLSSKQELDLSMREEVLSHLDTTCQNPEFITERADFFDACFSFGMFYDSCTRYGDAETCYQAALTGYKKGLVRNHILTLNAFHNLANLYSVVGRFEDSERMYDRALMGYKKKASGSYSLSALSTVNNIGLLYHNQGRLEDAERMYERALLGFATARGSNHTVTLDTVSNLGRLYADQGRTEDAKQLYEQALAGKEEALGPSHISTLDTVHDLGRLYCNQGRYEDAECMLERALIGYENARGASHLSTLNTVNSTGQLYYNQGRLEDAARMYERALIGYEKVWGPNHTSTLKVIGNLGHLYSILGPFEDAEQMFERALKGFEKALGPNHLMTLITITNLGQLYNSQGRFEDAVQMYEQALTCYEKELGPNHPLTLETVGIFGRLYTTQDRMEAAERMFERVSMGYEAMLGSSHALTLKTITNLGLFYVNQGRLEDAERMYGRSLAGTEEALGPNHLVTLEIVCILGTHYYNQVRLEDAERMYQRALMGYEKTLGSDHILTLGTLGNLGLVYNYQDRLKDAERMFERALIGYEKTLGPSQTLTLKAVTNLRLLYNNQGRPEDAERMFGRELIGYEKLFGPNHPSTLETVESFGNHYYNQGRFKDAERMNERALKGYEQTLGPDHSSTLTPVRNLGLAYFHQDRLTDAEQMYERALIGYEKALGPSHALTLETVGDLGDLCGRQGQFEEAEQMYKRALLGMETELGLDHSSTLRVVNNLGGLYDAQGRHDDTEMMFERRQKVREGEGKGKGTDKGKSRAD